MFLLISRLTGTTFVTEPSVFPQICKLENFILPRFHFTPHALAAVITSLEHPPSCDNTLDYIRTD